MVIEKITGGKPQELQKAEKAERAKAEPVREESAKTESVDSASVSERSRAAIKAYRIASESKPDISRAARVAEIKVKVMKGDYHAPSADVAEAILKSAAEQ